MPADAGWPAGPPASIARCTKAELILGHPIFPGEGGVDQLVEIIKARCTACSGTTHIAKLCEAGQVLGTPTREELMAMNPNYTESLGVVGGLAA